MKFGLRTPSLKKRFAARTSLKRYVRHSLGVKAPRGMGFLTNPKKAVYNRVYNRTSFSIDRLARRPRRQAGNEAFSSSGCLVLLSGVLAVAVVITAPWLIPVGAVIGYLVYANKTRKWPFLPPIHEQELLAGYRDLQSGKVDGALKHFSLAAPYDACASMFASAILGTSKGHEPEAIEMLEAITKNNQQFPTPAMKKYGLSWRLRINITPGVQADIPMNEVGAALLLAELYQERGFPGEAIKHLERVMPIANDAVLLLSLCELLAQTANWESIVNYAKQVTPEDDMTLSIATYYGRALHELTLDEAAISVFTQALRKKKDRSMELLQEARYWRAVSYERVGKKSQAKKEFQKLYAQAPDYRDVGERIDA